MEINSGTIIFLQRPTVVFLLVFVLFAENVFGQLHKQKNKTQFGIDFDASFFPISSRNVIGNDQFQLRLRTKISPSIGLRLTQGVGKGFSITLGGSLGAFFTKYQFRIDSLTVNGEPENPNFRLATVPCFVGKLFLNAGYDRRIKQTKFSWGLTAGVGFLYFQKAKFTTSVDYSLVQTNLPVYNQITTYINFNNKPTPYFPIDFHITYVPRENHFLTLRALFGIAPFVVHENEYVFYRGDYSETGKVNLLGVSFGASLGYSFAIGGKNKIAKTD